MAWFFSTLQEVTKNNDKKKQNKTNKWKILGQWMARPKSNTYSKKAKVRKA